MRYEIPVTDFEQMIGEGLWVGHEFACNGVPMIVTSIGQGETNAAGERIIPVDIVVMQECEQRS